MRKSNLLMLMACALMAAACSQDVPLEDKGSQGGPREGSTEEPAAELLGTLDAPAHQDSTAAGAPTMTGALRDSLHDGSATGIDQPDRPD